MPAGQSPFSYTFTVQPGEQVFLRDTGTVSTEVTYEVTVVD